MTEAESDAFIARWGLNPYRPDGAPLCPYMLGPAFFDAIQLDVRGPEAKLLGEYCEWSGKQPHPLLKMLEENGYKPAGLDSGIAIAVRYEGRAMPRTPAGALQRCVWEHEAKQEAARRAEIDELIEAVDGVPRLTDDEDQRWWFDTYGARIKRVLEESRERRNE